MKGNFRFFMLLLCALMTGGGNFLQAKEINEKVTNVIWNLDFEQCTWNDGGWYDDCPHWTIPNRGLSESLWPTDKNEYMSASVDSVVLKGWNAANHAMTKGNLLCRTITDLPEGRYTITADVHTNLYQKLYMFAQGMTDVQQQVTSNSDWGITEHVSVVVNVAQGRSLTFGLRLNENVTVNYGVDIYADNFKVTYERTAYLQQPVAGWANPSFETGVNNWASVNNTTIPNGGGWSFYRSTGTTNNYVSLAPVAAAKNTNYSMLANVSAHHGSNVAIFGHRTYATSTTSTSGACARNRGTVYQTLSDLPAGTYTATAWYRAVSTGSSAPTTKLYARKSSPNTEAANNQIASTQGSNYERISRSATISRTTITNVTFNKTWDDVEWRPLSITFTINSATTVYLGVEFDIPQTSIDNNYYYRRTGMGSQSYYAVVAECMVDDVILTKQDDQPTDGTYYLYNPATEKFLSRGSWYGTRAMVDDYGLPIQVKYEDGAYRLHPLDGNNTANAAQNYGEVYWMYSDIADTNNDARGDYAFRATATAKQYQIQDLHWIGDNADGVNSRLMYVWNREDENRYGVAANGLEGDNVDDVAQTYWQLKTQAERDAIIAAKQNAQAVAIASEAGLTASTWAELPTAIDAAKFGTELTEPKLSFANNEGGWAFGEKGEKSYVYDEGLSDWVPYVPTYDDNGAELALAQYGTFTKTVTGLEPGLYKVTLYGFHRDGTGPELYEKDRTDGLKSVTPAYISANGRTVQLKAWAGEATGTNTPTWPAEAKAAFDRGEYKNEVYAMVGSDGKLTLEVWQPSTITDSWTMLGDVKLTAYLSEKVTDGHVYYLYNPYSGRFLSAGNWWGAGAYTDEMGLPIEVTLADGYYRLRTVDRVDWIGEGVNVKLNNYYGGDGWMVADMESATNDAATKFTFVPVEGDMYQLRSKFWTDQGDQGKNVYVYMKEDDDKYAVAGNSIPGDNCADIAQSYWVLKTPAQRNAMLASNLEAQNVATAAESGVSVASTEELESLLAGKMSFDVTPASGISFRGSIGNWAVRYKKPQNEDTYNSTAYASDENGTETFDHYGRFTQSLTGLQEGLYKVTVWGFYREGQPDNVKYWHDNGITQMGSAYIRANKQMTQLKPWRDDVVDASANDPDNMGDGKDAMDAGHYKNELYAYVGSDGRLDLMIGNDAYARGNWIFLGDVTITYYVAGNDYYLYNPATKQYLGTHGDLRSSDNEWGTTAMMDNAGLPLAITGTGAIDTQVYGNVSDAQSGSGQHYLYVNGTKVELDGTDANTWTLEKSGTSYYIKNGSKYLASNGADKAVTTVTSKTTAASWQLKTYNERLQALRDMASGDDAVDATFLIRGNDLTRTEKAVFSAWGTWVDDGKNMAVYDNSQNGWADQGDGGGTYAVGGSVQFRRGGSPNNFVAECWHHRFDFWQTLSDLPYGVYTLTVQGMDGEGGTASQAYINDDETGLRKTADFQQNLNSGLKFWNQTLSDAFATARTTGDFDTQVVAKVTGESLTVGVKNDGTNQWSVWDNFRLTYRPFKLSDVTEEKTAINTSKTDLKNQGTGTFQIDVATEPHVQELNRALTYAASPVATKEGYRDAIRELLVAQDNFANASHDLAVNAPATGDLFNVKNISEGYKFKDNVLTFKAANGANLAQNSTAMGWTEAERSVYPQTVIFEKVGDEDLTASVPADGWLTGTGAIAGGPVNINGQSMRELYNSSSAGTKLYQNVTGLPAGTYRAVLYATSHNARGEDGASLDGTDNTTAYVFATANSTTKKTFFTARGVQPGGVEGEPEEVTIEGITVGSDGQLTLGLGLARAGVTGWHTIQIKSLTKVSYNEYTMSYERADGRRIYVGTGISTGLGNNENQLRPTTDAAKALKVKVDANTTADGTWWLRNSRSGDRRFGGNGSDNDGFYTSEADYGAFYDQALAPAATLELPQTIKQGVDYSTLVLPYDATLSNITAYTIDGVDDEGVLELSEVAGKKLDAFTPYLLYVDASAGDVVDNLSGYGSAYTDESYNEGLLTGTLLANTHKIPLSDNNGDTYVLNKQGQKVAFFHYTKNKDAYCAQFKAYLRVPKAANVKQVLSFPDMSTLGDEVDVEDIFNDVRIEGIYNVAGMRLPQLQKGVNLLKMTDGTVRKVRVK